jgi:Pentapeptide repeats (8 copies)
VVRETLTGVANDGSQHRKPGLRTVVEDVKAIATVLAMEAEAVLGRRPARVLGILALFAVVVGTLLILLDWYIAPGKAGERKDLILTTAQILGGTALLSGLYFTWRTLQVNREGQITERFTRAIDQLGATDDDGNPRLEIRLGGIYALERIARDSPARDYSTVMEVLTAYVRENAPWPTKSSKSPERDFIKPPEGGSVSDSASNDAPEQDKDAVHRVEPTSGAPRTDIQAILTVIARRERYYGNGEPESLDLQGTDLRGSSAFGNIFVVAEGVHLEYAYLQRTNFSKAHLEQANLQGANLHYANLQYARLIAANLEQANLQEANLSGANLSGANLREDQVSWTIGSNETMLPEGLNHPELWGKSFEEQAKILVERFESDE